MGSAKLSCKTRQESTSSLAHVQIFFLRFLSRRFHKGGKRRKWSHGGVWKWVKDVSGWQIGGRPREEPTQIGAGGWRTPGAMRLRKMETCVLENIFMSLKGNSRPSSKREYEKAPGSKKRALPSTGITSLNKPQQLEISQNSWAIKALRVKVRTTMYVTGMMLCPRVYQVCKRAVAYFILQMYYQKLWKSDLLSMKHFIGTRGFKNSKDYG